jgi:hypothetical protein
MRSPVRGEAASEAAQQGVSDVNHDGIVAERGEAA